jgi:hypothetical protein
VSNIVIDTSSDATDTIDYVATDTAGLTAASTRTVIVEQNPGSPAATTTSPTSQSSVSTITEATSTAQ